MSCGWRPFVYDRLGVAPRPGRTMTRDEEPAVLQRVRSAVLTWLELCSRDNKLRQNDDQLW